MEALALPETRLCRVIRFRAAHYYRLPTLDEEQNRKKFGAVAQSHEHDWVLTLWVTGPVDPDDGTVMDLGCLDHALKVCVLDRFHDKTINEVDPFFKEHLPTTEVLARFFAERLQAAIDPIHVVKVKVAESADLWSEYRP